MLVSFIPTSGWNGSQTPRSVVERNRSAVSNNRSVAPALRTARDMHHRRLPDRWNAPHSAKKAVDCTSTLTIRTRVRWFKISFYKNPEHEQSARHDLRRRLGYPVQTLDRLNTPEALAVVHGKSLLQKDNVEYLQQ